MPHFKTQDAWLRGPGRSGSRAVLGEPRPARAGSILVVSSQTPSFPFPLNRPVPKRTTEKAPNTWTSIVRPASLQSGKFKQNHERQFKNRVDRRDLESGARLHKDKPRLHALLCRDI